MKDTPLDKDNNLNDIFFEHVFTCITGLILLTDTYHSSGNSTYYSTVRNDKIKLHDPDTDDPDWMVKVAYTIMIAAVSEIETGVDTI